MNGATIAQCGSGEAARKPWPHCPHCPHCPAGWLQDVRHKDHKEFTYLLAGEGGAVRARAVRHALLYVVTFHGQQPCTSYHTHARAVACFRLGKNVEARRLLRGVLEVGAGVEGSRSAAAAPTHPHARQARTRTRPPGAPGPAPPLIPRPIPTSTRPPRWWRAWSSRSCATACGAWAWARRWSRWAWRC